ncbi:serine hydrolase [Streptomyces sp. NPDC006012]|uniref:D-alanyl-D-alanine carboxypeptidase family protein n=1 Tax=Streptomyces sp. NPDC006012 TaxID=3364739 RepID=UPI0036A01246
MADRTPDTGVLDQDDPSAGTSRAERGPSTELTAEAKERPSGEQMSKPEPPEETDGPGEPERADNTTDTADTPAHRTDDSDDPAPAESTEEPSDDAPGEATRAEAAAETGEAGELAGGEAAASESAENTGPVALRAPEDGAEAAGTTATGADGLARVEPPAPPAAEQDAHSPQHTPTAQDTKPAVAPLDPLDPRAHPTDTPQAPPPPARALRRGLTIWTPLVALLVLVVLVVVQLVRPLPRPVLALGAGMPAFTVGGAPFTVPWPAKGQAAVMVEGSGTIGTFGKQKPVPTASVAKVMTAYVILRGHPLKKDESGPRVTVDAQAVEDGRAKDESRIEGLRVGETFSLRDMLRMLMIPSGNNVARLLARWDTGARDETAFVRKMNEAARSLGMKNTTYTDPSGLDKGTVSTAVDQLGLAEAVMRSDAFRAVVALAGADIPGVGRITNNNERLLLAGLGVLGIKTGSNTAAGGTLSWAASKSVGGEDRLILGTMLDQHVTGADPNGANSLVLVQDNSRKVIAAVREALTSATVVREGQVVGHVDDGLGGRTPVVATRDLEAAGVPGQKLTLTLRKGGRDLVHGAPAGTVVGELALSGDAGARRVPVALQSELREPSIGTKLTRTG